MFNVNAVASENDDVKKMRCPGPECLCYFLQFAGVHREEGLQKRIQEVYDHMGWLDNRSLSWFDVQSVLEKLENSESAGNTSMEADVPFGDAEVASQLLSDKSVDVDVEPCGARVEAEYFEATDPGALSAPSTPVEVLPLDEGAMLNPTQVDPTQGTLTEAEATQDAHASAAPQGVVDAISESQFKTGLSLEDVVASLSSETIATISAQVAENWNQHKSIMPDFIRQKLTEIVPEAFAQKQFLAIATSHIGQRTHANAAGKKRGYTELGEGIVREKSEAAKVPRGSLASQSSQREVMSLSMAGTPAQADTKAKAVAADTAAKAVSKAQADTPAKAGPKSKNKGAQNALVVAPATPVAQSPRKKPSTMMQLMSPGRHLKQSTDAGVDVSGPLSPLTSVEILSHDATKSIRWAYTGFIVFRGDVRRNPDSQKEGSWKQICDFVVADSEAPLCMTLRDDELGKFVEALDAKSDDASFVCFKVENFRIVPTETSKWNGTVVSKMNRIQAILGTSTIPGTSLRVMSEAEAKMSAGSGRELCADICISNWDMLPQPIAIPSRLTLAGIVESKDDVTTTTPLDGTPKKKCKFTLIDNKGRWLVCSALGFNADAPALEVGNQVVLWFAVALKAWGSEIARCAVLNDGVIAAASDEKAMIPARVTQMQLQE